MVKMLFETERTFREIFENVQLVAIALDNDGNITFCNDFMLNMTGYKKTDLLGKNWFDIFIPRDDKVGEIFREAIRNGVVPLHHETPIVTKKGERRIMSWNNIVLRDPQGTVIGVASIGEDITERKTLEAQLLHAQKMESIGTLAGGIAHDFNNILTAIIGFANVVRRKMSGDDPIKFYIDQILDTAESGANLTRNLLAFSRKQVTYQESSDLNEIVRKLYKWLERIIGEHVEFTVDLTDGTLHIMVDFCQMEQVLMNLVVNARDAMPNGGVLTISTRRVRLGGEFVKVHGYGKPGEYALLSISDNGVGMDENTLKRIFEPFFTTKEIYKGTGLGLSIVYGIVKQHDGYIIVESQPGGGATFTIYIPLIPPQSKKAR